MMWVAFKMLVGNRGKYLGMIVGIFFAALIITQQLSIFTGLMSRTFGFLEDTRQADIWVMDPKVQFIDDVKPMQDTKLLRVRGVPGVLWAMPLYKGLLKARLANGTFQNTIVVGLDDATLIGGPGQLLKGSLGDLRRADSIIIDDVGARTKLAKIPATEKSPAVPLEVGDTVELNDHRALVVGIARVTRTFQSQPVIYTTYSRATTFAPQERKLLSFIMAKAKPGTDIQDLVTRIRAQTGLIAYTRDDFVSVTIRYYLKNTGIPINFGIAVILGFLVGTAIAGQTFFSFTTDNIRYLGALKAMGASNSTLLWMVVFQASIVGVLGYGLGVGVAALTSVISKNSELAFRFPWQLLVVSAGAVTLICIISAVLSLAKVLKLEPAIVFRS